MRTFEDKFYGKHGFRLPTRTIPTQMQVTPGIFRSLLRRMGTFIRRIFRKSGAPVPPGTHRYTRHPVAINQRLVHQVDQSAIGIRRKVI